MSGHFGFPDLVSFFIGRNSEQQDRKSGGLARGRERLANSHVSGDGPRADTRRIFDCEFRSTLGNFSSLVFEPPSLNSRMSSIFSSRMGDESLFDSRGNPFETVDEAGLGLWPKHGHSSPLGSDAESILDGARCWKHHEKSKETPPPPPPKEHSQAEIDAKKQEIAELQKDIEAKKEEAAAALLAAGAIAVTGAEPAALVTLTGAAAVTGVGFAEEIQLSSKEAELNMIMQENEAAKSQQTAPPISVDRDPYDSCDSSRGYDLDQTVDSPRGGGSNTDNIC